MMLWSRIKERRQLAKSLQQNALHEKLAQELSEKGYVDVSAVLDASLLQQLDEVGQAKLALASALPVEKKSAHKNFWTSLLNEDMSDGLLHQQSPFLRVAMQPNIVSILSSLYGEIPRLDYVLLTLSEYAGDQYKVSQLWHKDYDDTKVVKLFIYLTDVTSIEDGPFTFFSGPDSDKVGFSLKSHQNDRIINAKIGLKKARSMIAPKLTAFLVETSRCLHMGSRVADGHKRLLYTATYISSPRLYPEPDPKFLLTGAEGQIEKMLLTSDSK